jgi:hypothetical protein
MNVHTSPATAYNSALFAMPTMRRRIWTDRTGHLVETAVPVIPQKASVHWEAYVVDVETNQLIPGYPTVKETSVLGISDGQRPNDAIIQMYLNKVYQQVAPEQYSQLMNNVSNQSWAVANIIHTTQPLSN